MTTAFAKPTNKETPVKIGLLRVKKFLKLQRKVHMGEPLHEGKMGEKLFLAAHSVWYGLPIVSEKGRRKAEEQLAGLAKIMVNESAKATRKYYLLNKENRKEIVEQLMNPHGNGFSAYEAGLVQEQNLFQRRWVWGFGVPVTIAFAVTSPIGFALLSASVTGIAKYASGIKRTEALFSIAEKMQDFVADKLTQKAVA